MAQRQKAGLRFGPGVTQTTTAPVNTYSTPAVTQGEQLAQALAEVSPELKQFSSVLSDKYIDEQRAAGEMAAREASETAKKAGRLTRDGLLPMQDNPWFMAAFKEEGGRIDAGDWASDFKAFSDGDAALQDSTDLKDFDKAAAKHLGKWVQDRKVDRDGFYEKGFGHMKDQYLLQQRFAFANGIEDRLGKKSAEQIFAMTKRSVTDNWTNPDITPDAHVQDIETIVSTAVARGIPEKIARTSAVMGIRAAAKEMGGDKGLQVLELLSKVKGEGGLGVLKDQSYGAKALEETREELVAESYAEANREREEKKRKKDEALQAGVAEAFAVLRKNPEANMTRWLKDRPELNDPEIVFRLQSLQTQTHNLKFRTNQFAYDKLFADIWSPVPGHEVTVKDIVGHHSITADDQHKLISMLEHQKAAGGRKSELDKDVDKYRKLAYKRFSDSFPSIIGGLDKPDNAWREHQAKAQLEAEIYDLVSSGQAAQMDEPGLNQWFLDTSTRIAAEQEAAVMKGLHVTPVTPLNVTNKKQQGEVKFPETAVLTVDDLRDPEAIARKAEKLGIPPERLVEFKKQQMKILLAQ